MAHHYFIDGYNVLHTSTVLRPLVRQSFEAAREALIDKVALFCGTSENRASLVFDGRGKTYAEIAEHGRGVAGLEVVYTHGEISADAYIERKIYQAQNKRTFIVVSGDRGLRDLCTGMGAFVIDADNFLRTVREARADIDEAMRHRTALRQPLASLEDGLGADSAARMDEIRKRLR